MSRNLRVLSLFSGAGGADMALEFAGMDIAALCEIEPHARAVLRAHWPSVPLHGDVQTLDGTQYRGQVDVVVGGSPCQDLSVAGKRAGLKEGSGTRSSLFYDQLRIWNESQATYLIWENVKGAFSSSKGADFAAVLSAIVGRDIAVPVDGWKRKSGGVVCGPTAVAAWRLLDLQHFGVPQRRERIVVLASRAGGVDPAEVLAVGQSVSRDSAPRFEAREGLTADARAGAAGTRGFSTTASVGYVHDDVMPTLPHLTGLNCPGAQMMGVLNVPVTHTLAVNISDGRASLDDVMGTLDADGASTTAIGNQTRGVVLTYDARGTAQDQHIHQPSFRMVAFGEYAEDGTASAIKARDFKDATDLAIGAPGIPRRLVPIECERLMGWGDDWTRWGVNEKGVRYELADTPRYKLCGNGIGREWMEWVGLRLVAAVAAANADDAAQEAA